MVHAPILAIAVPLLGAFAAPLLAKLDKRARDAWVLAAGLAVAVFGIAVAVKVLGTGTPWVYTLGAPSPGAAVTQGGFPIRIILVVDALGAFMGIVTILAGAVGLLYGLHYLREEEGKTLGLSLLLLLWAGILGLVYTGDLFNFFVFLEITSIAACALIGYRVWESRPPEAAFKTMTMYTLGGLLVLVAVGLLYGEHGALNIAYLSKLITGSAVERLALGLLLGGLLMKAGAVPAHMWAPDAYGEAPAMATVVLVANTQASIYAIMRVVFTLFGGALARPGIGWLIASLGTATVIVAVLMALIQRHLGRLIAYGAVSQIGYMLLAVGVAAVARGGFGEVALRGGIFHMINDAASVGLLFLVAGAIRRAVGSVDIMGLGGLGRSLKWESGFFLLGALALAGIPPLNGFASKFLIYESTFRASPILSAIAVLASILLLAVVVRAFHGVFLGPEPKEASPSPKGMLIAMGILALLILVLGLFPGFFLGRLVGPAAKALLTGRAAYLAAVLGG